MKELDALRRRVALDLAAVEIPPRSWVPEAVGPDGRTVADVVIVGAGLSGLTVAFGLQRKGVERVEVIDAAPRGREGPWITTARMETLRSPKWLSGPDLGVPSLTYRAWHEARFGPESYDELGRIGRREWMEYLGWFRDVLSLPVRNDTRLVAVAEEPEGLRLSLRHRDGNEIRYCRRLVLATGIEGGGGSAIPAVVSDNLPPDRYSHSADRVDVATLAGRSVVVLGAAASAFDWAVAALGAGAARVDLVAREAAMPVTEILDWSNFPGFLEHFGELAPEDRLKFTRRMFAFRNPPTQEMYARATSDPRFAMHSGEQVSSIRLDQGRIRLALASGKVLMADHLLLGTGYEVDLRRRPELAGLAEHAATWGDRAPHLFARDDDPLRGYPFLDAGFRMTERIPGHAPALHRIHLFNTAAVLSLGPICNGVTGLKYGAPRLVSALTAGLFRSHTEQFFASLDTFDIRHFEPHAHT